MTGPEATVDATYWRELLAPIVAGRRIVLTGNPVAAQVGAVKDLRELGADDVLVVGEGMGTGEVPDCRWVALDVRGANIVEALREGQRLLADLPEDARAVIDEFDPGGEALVIGTFLNELPEVAGRACLAWRRPEWVALEDKIVADELWDAAGVAREPTRVVRVEDLVPEVGTVCAGDAREGFHGGAELTRWIRTAAEATTALELFRRHCDSVRVMPFLEGIPCSIHGIVFPGHVATLRPCEMVTLRRGGEFFYAGVATYWDPPAGERAYLRDVARRVGDELAARVGFRGAFTVDGVLTADGFRPTELNPRIGAGLLVLARTMGMPIELLNQALVAGLALDYRPLDFERIGLEAADAHRTGGTWRAVDTTVAAGAHPVVWTGEAWRRAEPGEAADGHVTTGPSNVGGLLRLLLAPERTPVGPSIAPLAIAFYAYADRELGTAIGPLEGAVEVRRG